jgi:sugar phosphate isomerase/epimerase
VKLGAIPIHYFVSIGRGEMRPEDWYAEAAEVGLDGVELYDRFVGEWSEGGVRRQAEAIRAAGLEVSMYTTYCDFGPRDPKVRAAQQATVVQGIRSAVLAGSGIVRVVAGNWVEGQGHEETLGLVAEGLRGCLDAAEEQGVVLAFEDHPVIGTAPADFLRILELVGDERLKINLDTSNPMESGATVLDLLPAVAPRVVHVHASDRAANLDHVVTGTGVVPLGEVFGHLKSAGYEGYVSMEIGGPPERASTEASAANVRHLWDAAPGRGRGI